MNKTHLCPLRSAPKIFSLAAAIVGLGIAGMCLSPELSAQSETLTVTTTSQLPPPLLTNDELVQLLSPIALYPDALVAILLPASTVPSDIVLAKRYLENKGDPDLANRQPWDDSVKSLVRYPDLVQWLNENLEWTAAVGEAFVEQPADVMNTIQALRQQARAAGNLVDTPQQKIVVEKKHIRILPADPEYIYIPQYDPQVVYVESYNPQPLIPLLSFGVGFAVGTWLNYDFDWGRNSIYRGDWRGWDYDQGNGWNRGWGNNRNSVNNASTVDVVNINNNNNNVTAWQPSANALQQINQRRRNNDGNARYIAQRDAVAAQRAEERAETRAERADGRADVREARADARAARFDPEKATNMPRPGKLERRTTAGAPSRDREARGERGRRNQPAATPTVVDAPPSQPADLQEGERLKREASTPPRGPTRRTDVKRQDMPPPAEQRKGREGRGPIAVPTGPAPSLDEKPRKKEAPVRARDREATSPATDPQAAPEPKTRKPIPQPTTRARESKPDKEPTRRTEAPPSAPREVKKREAKSPQQVQPTRKQAPPERVERQPTAPKKQVRREPERPKVQPTEKRKVEQPRKQEVKQPGEKRNAPPRPAQKVTKKQQPKAEPAKKKADRSENPSAEPTPESESKKRRR